MKMYYKVGLIIISIVVFLLIILDSLLFFLPDKFLPLPSHQPFANVWEERTKTGRKAATVVKDMMGKLFPVLDHNGVELVAFFGTLLGMVRHEGLIPWDDNMNFVISRTQKPHLWALKETLHSKGFGIVDIGASTRIYNLNEPLIPGTEWSWPFLDVFCFDIKGGEVTVRIHNSLFNTGNIMSRNITIKIQDLFPLRSNLLKEYPINMPNDPDVVLGIIYGYTWPTICKSSSWNNRKEKSQDYTQTLCKDLQAPQITITHKNAWVINLARRSDRWKKTNHQLRKLGIYAKRWLATDKDSPSFLKEYKNILTSRLPGEVACYQSHYKLWQYLYNTEVPGAIIFEDDIDVPPALTLEHVTNAINESRGFNILLLGHCSSPFFHRSPEKSTRIGTAQCTHAYAVSRAGLEKLLSVKPDFRHAVDDFLYEFCTRELCYYAKDMKNPHPQIFGGGFFHQDRSKKGDIERNTWNFLSL